MSNEAIYVEIVIWVVLADKVNWVIGSYIVVISYTIEVISVI